MSDNQYRFLFAAFYGDIGVMQELKLIGGYNINGQDRDGRTALGVAAS